MSLRLLSGADRELGADFLEQHISSSMFPLANLQDYGESDHPRAVTLYGVGTPLRGVVAISHGGTLFPQLPHPQDWPLLRDVTAGRQIAACLGRAEQVAACIDLLQLPEDQARLNSLEPLMELSLDKLILPDGAGQLVPLPTHRETACLWRADYGQEVLGWAASEADQQAERDIALYIERDSHRFLELNGQPVAMTGFNARLPGIVQIGGVFTPPGLRGRGYARHALALHLKQAYQSGVTRSVLFASGPAAEAAYRSIGYRQIGAYRMFELRAPHPL